MRLTPGRSLAAIVAVVALGALGSLPSAGAAEAAGRFSCRADALSLGPAASASDPAVANAAGDPCATDAHSTSGPGELDLLRLGLVSATTAAATDSGTGTATVGDIALRLAPGLTGAEGLLELGVRGVESTATAGCQAGMPTAAGSSRIVGLTLNGVELPLLDLTAPLAIDLAPLLTLRLNQTERAAGLVTQRALVLESSVLGVRLVLGEASAGFVGDPCGGRGGPSESAPSPVPVSPEIAGLPGKVAVIVDGGGLLPGAVIVIDGVPFPATVSGGQAVAIVPEGALRGRSTTSVSVRNPIGTPAPTVASIRLAASPTAVGLSPAGALPGARVTIQGSGFGALRPPDGRVTVRGQTAAIAAWSDGAIRIHVPNLTPGPSRVVVHVGALSSDPLALTVLQPPAQPPLINLVVLPQPDGSLLIDTSLTVDADGALSGRPRGGMVEHDLFNGVRQLLTSIDGGRFSPRQTQFRQLAPGTHDIRVRAAQSRGRTVTLTRKVVIPRPGPLSGSGSSARLVVPAPLVPPANISIPSQVAFDFGSAELRPESRTYLLRVGRLVRRSAGSVRVIGYTDDVGAPEESRQLSLERARAVRDFLIRRVGIPAGRLGAVGRGAANPIASNATEIGRQRNRRVVVAIPTPTKPTVLHGAKAIARARLIHELENQRSTGAGAGAPPPSSGLGPPDGLGIY